MVPASTLRRKEATMTGSTNSTPNTMAATMSSVVGMANPRERESAVDRPHDTAPARGVHVRDAQDVAGADADAAGAIVRSERGEELHDLTVDIDGDEPTAVGVEAGHGARVVLDGALQREGWTRLEAKEEAPDRADEQRFKRRGAEDGCAQPPRLTEWLREESTGAEADQEREQHARREKRLHPRGAVVAGVGCVASV